MRKLLNLKLLTVSLGLILLLAGTAGATWNPAGFQKWQDSEIDSLSRQWIGGEIANYPESNGGDTTWHGIEGDWLLSGDTLVYNHKDILKTWVKPNGVSIVNVNWNGVDYTVTQKLKKLIWLKTDTWNWVDVVDSVTWTTPSVDSNIISWNNVFPGVNYKIRKSNASVAHGIFFKKAFLDSAVTLYNQRSDSLTIALGNVVEYSLVNVDHADSAIGNVDKRKLKQLGKYVFSLTEQRVHFPGSDTLPHLKIRQRWVKQAGKLYCIEYVMMSRIKQIHAAYPNAVIWHNDTKKIEGTTNVEDSWFVDGGSNLNYGGDDHLIVDDGFNAIVRVLNVASELGVGATISSCTLSMNAYFNEDFYVYVWRVFKPWVEGTQDGGEDEPGVTGFDWDNDDWEWTTAGCNSADDGGSDNSGDGTGADRKATVECSVYVDENGWWAFEISSSLAQSWYEETVNRNGVLLKSGGYSWYRSTEYASEQPYWVFVYTTDGAPAGQVIIIGARYEEDSHNPRRGIPPAMWE